jgi:elongation factor G
MKSVGLRYYSLKNIRNIGIIAHIDAGKTTTSERMLFYAGHTRRLGDVDRGDTVMDYLPEERERGITITAAAITFQWQRHTINLIDTPGHVDFGMEVERSLRVLDGAVAILDGSAGVQAQTRTVWRQASRFGIPRILYVNKMDKIGADFVHTLKDVREKLSDITPVPLQYPIMKNDRVHAIADLINEKILHWSDADGRTIQVEPWNPSEFKNIREVMLEQVASLDEILLEKYLEGRSDALTPTDIRTAIRRLTLASKIAPVLCGSSFTNIGVQPILDAVIDYLPSPEERPSPTVLFDSNKTGIWKSDDPRLLALAFKVVHDDQRGLLVFVRVYSGRLTTRSALRNSTRGIKERATRIMSIYANQFEELDEAPAGSVVVLLGLRGTRTGDTLTAVAGELVKLSGIQAPLPVFTRAVEAESLGEEDRLEEALSIVELEDPSVRVNRDPQTGQKHISGMGELHLEIVGKRIIRDLKAKAVFGPVQISYKEQVILFNQTEFIDEEIDKEVSGKRMIAGLKIQIESIEDMMTPIIEIKQQPSNISGLDEAIREGIEAALQEGPTASLPLIGIKLTVIRVDWKEGSSLEAFRYATFHFIRNFLSTRRSRLAEPIMDVEITVPTAYLGAVLTDIHSTKRGIVTETITNAENDECMVWAKVPLAAMLGYATSLRSKTAGAGSFTMHPLSYQLVSQDEATRILQRIGLLN